MARNKTTRTRPAPRPEPPKTVWGYLSKVIEKELERLANMNTLHLIPRTITTTDVVNLCVHEEHKEYLRGVLTLAKDRIRLQDHEQFYARLPYPCPQHVMIALDAKADQEGIVLAPDYARVLSKCVPITSAPMELVAKMANHAHTLNVVSEQWSTALGVFRYLDKYLHEKFNRQHFRYIFPGVVPLLREAIRHRENYRWDDYSDKIFEEIYDAVETYSDTSQRWFRVLPAQVNAVRPLIAEATDLIAAGLLLKEKPWIDERMAIMRLIYDSDEYQHGAMPDWKLRRIAYNPHLHLR